MGRKPTPWGRPLETVGGLIFRQQNKPTNQPTDKPAKEKKVVKKGKKKDEEVLPRLMEDKVGFCQAMKQRAQPQANEEAGGTMKSVAEGISYPKPGDHVLPIFIGESKGFVEEMRSWEEFQFPTWVLDGPRLCYRKVVDGQKLIIKGQQLEAVPFSNEIGPVNTLSLVLLLETFLEGGIEIAASILEDPSALERAMQPTGKKQSALRAIMRSVKNFKIKADMVEI